MTRRLLSDWSIWCKTRMSALNEDAPNRDDAFGQLRRELQELLQQTHAAGIPELEADRRDLMRFVGFGVSSLESHAQRRRSAPGAALDALEAGEFIQLLGDSLGHVPRDSLYTYCLWNTGDGRIAFTRDQQEDLFVDVVAVSLAHIEAAIRTIDLALMAHSLSVLPDVAELLNKSASELSSARLQFSRFRGSLTKEFFLGELRQYNVPWVIGGREWHAPTAADSAAQIELDLLCGFRSDEYMEHVNSRAEYLTRADREQVELMIGNDARSLTEMIRATIATVPDVRPFANPYVLRDAIQKLTPERQEVVRAAHGVLLEAGKLTARHFQLVDNYLESEPEAPQRGPVASAKGTSGMSVEQLAELVEMRRFDPMARTLNGAMMLLSGRATEVRGIGRSLS
ncbi:MAG: monodechloroaminopyrrolnitrin synthase PrnB family protein [Acidimicrobiia bacterium]